MPFKFFNVKFLDMPKMVTRRFDKTGPTLENLGEYLKGMPDRIGFEWAEPEEGAEQVAGIPIDEPFSINHEGYVSIWGSFESGARFRERRARLLVFPSTERLTEDHLSGDSNLSYPCSNGVGHCHVHYFTNKLFRDRKSKEKNYDPALCQRRVEIAEGESGGVYLCPAALLRVDWLRYYCIESVMEVSHNADSVEGPILAERAIEDIKTHTRFGE